MGTINKAIIIGNLGRDPDVRQLEGGRSVANFSVATHRRWKDRETGEPQEKTDWHRVVAWGVTADSVGRFLGKGSQVCVEGRIETRSWQDREGHDRTTTEIVADRVIFLDRGEDRGERSDGADLDAGSAQAPEEAALPF